MSQSPFLEIASEKWLLSNDLAFAVFDGFPVSVGHTLVLTKRLVASWFDATAAEQVALMSLVNEVKEKLDATLDPQPDGYNVGFNSGESAGQTVMHVHIHVIPRYTGDMPDPRGGVRHVIPHKGNYLADFDSNPRELPPNMRDTAELQPSKSKPAVIYPPAPQTSLALTTGYPASRLWDQLSHRIIGAHLVEILASFVQNSGLDVIEQRLFQLLNKKSNVRILVSDYLSISDPSAIKRLHNWQQLVAAEDEFAGELSVRLVEMAKLPSNPQSFHPKSWRIIDSQQSFIAVGSSNLSRPALQTGIEWNLLSSSPHPLAAHDDFAIEFNSLWNLATPVTVEVVNAYAAKAKADRKLHFEPESLDERFVPDPRPWQSTALESLQRIRDAGYGRALVAVATGMGKTWLAAFDVRQIGQRLGRKPRVLVVAHRLHILIQGESALSCILEDAFGPVDSSWYIGSQADLCGDLVIASVQKLCRPDGLKRLAEEQFDYAIIDEVHHAHAPTYRRVIAQLNATFILGLTATPERGDGVDVASIFDDNLAHQATIGDGIEEESLVPFHYVGVRDTVDFEQIPWRNGRFDLTELEKRVERSERMNRLWAAMQQHSGARTIAFCCSRRHAMFARDWLRSKGVSSAAVFSGDGSDSQIGSLEALRTGQLETLCVVDMFNEGLDITTVDRVIMLRPTESKVIFLQQLGRGLRAAEGKSRLLVIDFVGNHRIFAQRMIHLMSLGGKDASWSDLKKWIDGEQPELPAGCLLDVELEARDVLAQFIPEDSQAGLETYRVLRDEMGRRPQAAELLAHNILPKTVSRVAGSWFQFVDSESDLETLEQEVVSKFLDWLKTVETTSLNKSYKMVVLRVLLDFGDLFNGVNLPVFSERCRRFMLQHPVLSRDLLEGKHAVDHQHATNRQWAEWWRKWPVDRWLDEQNGHRWFSLDGEVLRFAVNCPKHLRVAMEAMTEELVDWRLAAYSKSHRLVKPEPSEIAFEAKVSHSGGRPILRLPDKTIQPVRPVGLVVVQLPDETAWEFKFVRIACNVAKPMGGTKNEISALLRSWFGENAGLPGTDFKVLFETKQGRWHAHPLNAKPQKMFSALKQAVESKVELAIERTAPKRAQYKTHVPVYDLVAAAGGWGEEGAPQEIGWTRVSDRPLSRGMFVAKVVGQSMEPTIPSESWCLFRPCPNGSRQNRLLLAQINTHLDPVDGGRYTVKKYHSEKRMNEDGWEHQSIVLVPLNPEFQPIKISPEEATDIRIIGEFVKVISSN